MLPQDQHSKMTYIALIAAFLSIFVLHAGVLAVITGFAAVDEIQKYHYKGKILAKFATIFGGLCFFGHLILINVYKSNALDWLQRFFGE